MDANPKVGLLTTDAATPGLYLVAEGLAFRSAPPAERKVFHYTSLSLRCRIFILFVLVAERLSVPDGAQSAPLQRA